MRAIIIDPHKREVREAVAADYPALKQLVADGELGKRAAPLTQGTRIEGGAAMWVDDEGFFRPGQAGFFLDGLPNPFAGYGVILGLTRFGNSSDCPPHLTIPIVYDAVIWSEPEEARALVPPIVVTGPDSRQEFPIDFSDVRPLK